MLSQSRWTCNPLVLLYIFLPDSLCNEKTDYAYDCLMSTAAQIPPDDLGGDGEHDGYTAGEPQLAEDLGPTSVPTRNCLPNSTG